MGSTDSTESVSDSKSEMESASMTEENAKSALRDNIGKIIVYIV